ncbi:MAG: hypothetical protein PHV61_07260 [Limnochordia bacterium]|nr:hypothetical protein [Limnochordia bacterium]
MPKINEIELQSIRHLIGDALTGAKKLSFYAEQCEDPRLKNVFQSGAKGSQQMADKLMGFLS